MEWNTEIRENCYCLEKIMEDRKIDFTDNELYFIARALQPLIDFDD